MFCQFIFEFRTADRYKYCLRILHIDCSILQILTFFFGSLVWFVHPSPPRDRLFVTVVSIDFFFFFFYGRSRSFCCDTDTTFSMVLVTGRLLFSVYSVDWVFSSNSFAVCSVETCLKSIRSGTTVTMVNGNRFITVDRHADVTIWKIK